LRKRKWWTHTYTHREIPTMGTKNIAISDEAYQMLKALKKSGESFTEVIERMTRRSAVLELAGTMSRAEAADVEKQVRALRKKSSRRMLRITEGLK
jgi:predicted CopG family antitoxin